MCERRDHNHFRTCYFRQPDSQGFRNQALLSIDARVDGRGNPYFWLAFAKARFEPGHGSDLKAIAEKKISVTPLRFSASILAR